MLNTGEIEAPCEVPSSASAQSAARTGPQVYANSQSQVSQARPSATPTIRTGSPLRANTQIRRVQPQAATPTFVTQSSINVRYLESSPIRVREIVSGVCYEFSGSHVVQLVDARDASPLLNTGFFRRV